MKKIIIFFILCSIFLTFSLFAQEDEIAWNYGNEHNKVTPDEDIAWTFEEHKEEKPAGIFVGSEKGLVRVPDRKLEISLFNFNLGFSNDFITTYDIFKEKIEIDIDELSGGFNVNVNLAVNPLIINYNLNDICGFGISTGFDLIGDIGLNGNMLTFNEDDSANSNINAAIFADVKIHGFYTYEKFKIKVKPALYYPLLYAKSDKFTYTYTNKNTDGVDETIFNMGFDMRVYTAFTMGDDFDISDFYKNITAKPGFDISIGADYPLSEALGINKKFIFLDFDVGIDFINIPVYPSKMEDYMRMLVNIGSDKPIDFFNGMFGEDTEDSDMENFYKYDIEEHGKEEKNVIRPFKTLLSANWRPFYRPSPKDTDELIKRKKEWLTFSPILGFSVNPLYSKPFSFEGGVKTRLSLANLFIITLDTGYYDRLWKNGLNLGFNFRIFEVDIGVSMQSKDFIKSWLGGGFGASFALKLGW
jgi:hypothetical protein